MKKVFTIGQLKKVLEVYSDDLPLSEAVGVEFGYDSPNGFFEMDEGETKPENSKLAVDIFPIYTKV